MQTMSQAPFRLVDEINQGMDATNECNIFRQVCRTSCIMDEVVPQTFVISPKLLTNLEYTEGSTVHVVFSGVEVFCADEQNEHDPSLWNVRDFLERDGGKDGKKREVRSSSSDRAAKRLRMSSEDDSDDDGIIILE